MAIGKDVRDFKRGLIIGTCMAVASVTRTAHLVSVSIRALSKVTSVFRFRQSWMSNCPLGNAVRDQNDSNNNHVYMPACIYMLFISVLNSLTECSGLTAEASGVSSSLETQAL